MDFGRAARDASRNRAAVKDGIRTTDGTNAQAHCADDRNGKAKGGAQLRPRLVRSRNHCKRALRGLQNSDVNFDGGDALFVC
jgi:hypothetical protein